MTHDDADDDITYRIGFDASGFDAVMRDLEARSHAFGGALTQALKAATVDGRTLESTLRGVAARISGIALNAGLKPLEGLVGNAIAGLTQGLVRATPFAKGGIVSQPTYFPMNGGLGLMGEAGSEAILPLARGSDGRLGVAATTGAGAPITINITTPDATSFRKAEAQVTAMLARAVGRGQRGL